MHTDRDPCTARSFAQPTSTLSMRPSFLPLSIESLPRCCLRCAFLSFLNYLLHSHLYYIYIKFALLSSPCLFTSYLRYYYHKCYITVGKALFSKLKKNLRNNVSMNVSFPKKVEKCGPETERARERERQRDGEGFIRVMRNSVQTHGRADNLVDLRFVSIAHVRLTPSAAFSPFAIFSGKPFILVVGSDAEHR